MKSKGKAKRKLVWCDGGSTRIDWKHTSYTGYPKDRNKIKKDGRCTVCGKKFAVRPKLSDDYDLLTTWVPKHKRYVKEE